MRISANLSTFFLFLLFLGACAPEKKKSKYPGFSETKSGLFYHRHNIGEGKNYPENNDFLVLHLTFKTLNNKVIPLRVFKNENGFDTLHFKNSDTKFMLYEALEFLSEGDSCTFILNANLIIDTAEFKGITAAFKNDSIIKLEAKLLFLKTLKQQEQEKIAEQKLCAEMAADEQLVLQHFLDTTKQSFPKTPDENGLYFSFVKKGKGKAAKTGDNIILRYIGKFLDGKVFDVSTYEKEAINFRLGEPGQVIKGIELALYKMHEGDIANLLVPSSLAFGSKGSAGGIVSPFKTVTFALEILKIN